MIGSTIDGKYQIKKLLGEGAMGSVYEAEHTATGRRCAVKVISSADLTRDPKVVSRFQREARAAGAIDTQHITQVLDAGVDRESQLPFLAMEFLAGEDLQALLKRVGPIAPDLALRIVAQACLGLQKAHEANVVHRDIKPHNLFLARRDAGEIIIKLLDFGIAKVKMDQANETESAELTRTGNLLGSPLYMSPEQARGQKEIDHRTDIWSMGAVLYQALTGRTPYHHITALGQLIIAICSEPPPPVQEYAPWVPPEVAAVVHRCLQQDPGRRFQSAGEMFNAIRPLLPYGWNIHEEMVVSLQDSVRMQSAPRLQMSVPPPAMMTQGAGSGGYGAVSGSMQPPPMPSVMPPGAVTTGALTQSASQSISQAKPSRLPVVLGASFFTVLLIGGGVFAFRATTAPPAPAPTQAAPVETAPEPAATPTQAATAAPAPEEKETKKVQVVILPPDAEVEVEGKAVATRGGILTLTGRVGDLLQVRVFKGKNETIADIAILEGGAFPPKIEVTVGSVRLPQPKPGGSAAPAGTGAPPPPPPPAPAAPTGIKTNTDEFSQ